jgi:hypothetical protein
MPERQDLFSLPTTAYAEEENTHFPQKSCVICSYKVKLSCYTPWRRLAGEAVQLLLILGLGGEWSGSCPGRALPPGKEPPVPIG